MEGHWRLKGYKLIIMGDFNSDKNDPDLEKFLAENNLIDVVGETNKGTPPMTYARGRRQIDYIFCDADLKKSVKKSGSRGLHEGLISDHTMQWADFEVTEIFGGQPYNPALPSERQSYNGRVGKRKTQ